MTEPSFDFSEEVAVSVARSRLSPEQDVPSSRRERLDGSDRHALKVLFANKFFFRNGGSEVVMFDDGVDAQAEC